MKIEKQYHLAINQPLLQDDFNVPNHLQYSKVHHSELQQSKVHHSEMNISQSVHNIVMQECIIDCQDQIKSLQKELKCKRLHIKFLTAMQCLTPIISLGSIGFPPISAIIEAGSIGNVANIVWGTMGTMTRILGVTTYLANKYFVRKISALQEEYKELEVRYELLLAHTLDYIKNQ